ncbi:unnamed protein product [Tilletia caries]|nr:unnamed protein product [Tilletia caries]CAD6915566.1 unnamed protein product [Tilletia caries]
MFQAKPSYKKWKRTPLWYYDRMDDLVAESTATGSYALDPRDPPTPATAPDAAIVVNDSSEEEVYYEGWGTSDTESSAKSKRSAPSPSGGGGKKAKPSALKEISSVARSVNALVKLEETRMEMEMKETRASRSASDAVKISLSALMQIDQGTFSGAELGVIAFEVTKTPALLSTWSALSQLPEPRIGFLRQILSNAASPK